MNPNKVNSAKCKAWCEKNITAQSKGIATLPPRQLEVVQRCLHCNLDSGDTGQSFADFVADHNGQKNVQCRMSTVKVCGGGCFEDIDLTEYDLE